MLLSDDGYVIGGKRALAVFYQCCWWKQWIKKFSRLLYDVHKKQCRRNDQKCDENMAGFCTIITVLCTWHSQSRIFFTKTTPIVPLPPYKPIVSWADCFMFWNLAISGKRMSVSIGGGNAIEGSRAAEPYLHGMLASMDVFGIIVLTLNIPSLARQRCL